MATIRDDLGKLGKRLLETVEQRTGQEVVPRERMEVLESAELDARVMRKTLDFIGFSLLNYQPGLPGLPGGFELRPQIRRFAARESLRAWLEDPMAGQQVDLYISFVFGRGVPRPQAHDPEVQKRLDETWDDPANKRILTSFGALVEKGIDLCVQSNVFFTFFDDGEDGMVRVSLLRFDDVDDVVRHDDVAAEGRGDRFRILYYRVLERRAVYDYKTGARTVPPSASGPTGPGLPGKIAYYEALDAFDDNDPVMRVQDQGLRRPPPDMVKPGRVVHLAVNKTSEMAFGVPRMRRLVRWFTAYNETLESHVERMKAMASVYMKATAKGTQRDLDRLAMMATGRSGAFGAAQDPGGPARPHGPSSPGILGQNESLNYEPFKIDSGANDVQASAPIIRGQLNGPWPDHYTAGQAPALAGASAMELPPLKFVEREQELWSGLLGKLCDRAIARAIEVGDITEYRDPTDAEVQQIQAAELAGEPAPFEMQGGQVKRDLGFDISLPSPLKRAMGDLVSAAVQTATAVDPNGQNAELSRWLLGFILAEAFDVSDPQRIVDQVLPRRPEATSNEAPPGAAPPPGEQPPGSVGPDGQRHPADNPYGAPGPTPPPEQQATVEAAVDPLAGVQAVAAAHLAALAGAPNGNGSGGG